jgi:leucyl-tRNA synthetase
MRFSNNEVIKNKKSILEKIILKLNNISSKVLSFGEDLGGVELNSIKVFTTRPDTIFGATYVVLSPEHKLISELKLQITNWKEVEKYIKSASAKTEIERIAEGKEKTGIELKGIKAINPANTQALPVYIADYVLATYGTGAIMAVPAHDERDFEFAKKYDLPIKQVIAPYFPDSRNPFRPGKKTVFREVVHSIIVNPKDGKVLCLEWKKFPWNTFIIGGKEEGESSIKAALREIREETGYKNVRFVKKLAGPFVNKFYAAHKDINRIAKVDLLLFELDDEEKDFISEEENAKHNLVWIDKSKLKSFIKGIDEKEYEIAVFERGGETCFLGEGVLVNSSHFDLMESVKAKKEIVKFVGGKMKTTYKLRDWVFSRQRYWGEPIPVLHKDGKVVPVKERDLPVILPKVKSYEPTGTGESPLAGIDKWVNVKGGLKRETNTMPQWAGSSWYYLRFMDPNNSKALVDKKKETYWNQVDFYVGGAEHATRHLIYARFWHKFLYDIGVVSTKEPFKKLQSVGLIMGADGRKMSKRFGNVINPDSIVDIYGADTLRLYEMFMGPFEQIVAWNEDAIVGPRRFLERVWKFQFRLKENKIGVSQFIINSINLACKNISKDIENMKFNTAVSQLMILLNYFERQDITIEIYETFLQLLAPFAPHITEEIWQNLYPHPASPYSRGRSKEGVQTNSIHLSKWPAWDEKLIQIEKIKIAIQVNGKVRGEIVINIEDSEDQIKDQALKNTSVIKYLNDKKPKKVIYIKNRLINIVV